MGTLKTPCVLGLVLGLLVPAALFAQPKLGAETVASDAPAEVREQIARMRSASPRERAEAIYQLQRLRQQAAPAVPALLVALDDPDAWVRASAIEALGATGDRRATKPLIALLKAGDALTASRAAKALGNLKDPAAVEPLIAAIESPHPSVRSSAAFALGLLKDPRAVDPLVAALKKSDNGAFAYALGAIGQADSPVIDALLGGLKSPRWHTRQASATALGQLKVARAVEPLIAALGDPDWRVRYAAAYSLGQIGDLRAGDALRMALDDPQLSVRDRAAEALRMLQFRVWKDREGHELARGVFLGATGPSATLKKADGTCLVVLLEQLSVEDRQYVQSQVSQQQSRARWKSGAAQREADQRAQASKLVQELTEAIQRNPRDPELYLRRAEAWAKTKGIASIPSALADCDAALRLDPQSARAFYVRGTIEMSGWPGYEAALASLKEALRRKPDYPEARSALAATYGQRWCQRLRYADPGWDLAQAVAELDEALRLDPACASALWARGLARAKSGRVEQAQADFQQAARLDPDAEWTALWHGLESFKKGNLRQAVADFVELIALDFRLGLDYAHRGHAYHIYGQYDRALADYNRAVRADPLMDLGWMRRAWLRATCPEARYRDARLALADAREAVALSRKPAHLEVLAAAHAEAGNFAEAVRTQEEAIAMVQKGDRGITDAEKRAMQVRLELYRAGKPYRETPQVAPGHGAPGPGQPGREAPRAGTETPALPRVVGVLEERRNFDGRWVPLGPGELAWGGEQVRWAPRLEPDDRSRIASFRLLKRPAETPEAPWVEVARAGPGEQWAVGALGVGFWQIRIEVRLTCGTVITWP